MCKVTELARINAEIKALEDRKAALTKELIATMSASGVDKMFSEDGTRYAKWCKVADKLMPAHDAYIKKGYEYIRLY